MNDHLIPEVPEDSEDYEYCMEIYIKEKSPNTKPSYLFDPLKNWIYIEPVFLVLRVGVTS